MLEFAMALLNEDSYGSGFIITRKVSKPESGGEIGITFPRSHEPQDRASSPIRFLIGKQEGLLTIFVSKAACLRKKLTQPS